MLRSNLQALVAGHCTRIAWGGDGTRPLCRGVFQAAPNFEMLALIGTADIADPAVEAARQAGYISEVRVLTGTRGADVAIAGPSGYMEPAAWAEAVDELEQHMVRHSAAMIGVEVWLADDELSSLALLLSSASIRGELQALGFDIPDESYIRERLAERRSLYPGLLEAATDAEVQLLMRGVA